MNWSSIFLYLFCFLSQIPWEFIYWFKNLNISNCPQSWRIPKEISNCPTSNSVFLIQVRKSLKTLILWLKKFSKSDEHSYLNISQVHPQYFTYQYIRVLCISKFVIHITFLFSFQNIILIKKNIGRDIATEICFCF